MSKKIVRSKKTATFLTGRLTQINSMVTRLEKEVEKTVGLIRKQGTRSADRLAKRFDKVINQLGAGEFRHIATVKTEEIRKDLLRVSEDVAKGLRSLDIPFDRSIFIKVRSQVTETLSRLNSFKIVTNAKEVLGTAKNQVLSALEVPTTSDIATLTRKLDALERKLKVVSQSQKAKRAA